LRTGAQKKTKRYMEPSKTVDAAPRASTCGLERIDQTLFFGWSSFSSSFGVAVSP
jgi:hypothetical protein